MVTSHLLKKNNIGLFKQKTSTDVGTNNIILKAFKSIISFKPEKGLKDYIF